MDTTAPYRFNESWTATIQQYKRDADIDLNTSLSFSGVVDPQSFLSMLDSRHNVFGLYPDLKGQVIGGLEPYLKLVENVLRMASYDHSKSDAVFKFAYGSIGNTFLIRKDDVRVLVSILGLCLELYKSLYYFNVDLPVQAGTESVELLDRTLRAQVRVMGLASKLIRSEAFGGSHWEADFIINEPSIKVLVADMHRISNSPDHLPFSKSIIRQALFQVGRSSLQGSESNATLNMGIRVGEEALADSSLLSLEERLRVMDGLGFMKTTRFNSMGMRTDIIQAVDLCRQVVDATPKTDIERPSRLDNLGYCLSARYDVLHDARDLDDSIDAAREALLLANVENDHVQHHQYLSNLSARLFKRYYQSSRLADQTEAISLVYNAASLREHLDSHKHAVTLQNLAAMLLSKFEKTKFRRDLEEVIRILKLAYSQCPEGYEERGVIAFNLGEVLMRRYNLTKDVSDLKLASQVSGEAVNKTELGSRYRWRCLNNWVTQLKELFAYTNADDDLENALDAAIHASNLCPDGTPVRFLHLKNAESLLGTKFLRNPSFDNWFFFTSHMLTVLSEIPLEKRSEKFKDDEYRTGMMRKLLSQLGRVGYPTPGDPTNRMSAIFLRTLHRELSDKSETVDFVEALADLLNGCANVRFDVHIGDSDAVMAEAEEFTKQAASFGLTEIRLRFRLLNVSLHEPDKENDDVKDPLALPIAIRQAEKDIAESKTDVHRGVNLSRLASLLRDRFLRNNSLYDLNKAVDSAERAFTILDDNKSPVQRAPVAFILAMTLKSRYQRLGSAEDLERCVKFAQEAIMSIDELGFNNKVSILNNYVLIMRLSYQMTHALVDIDRALEASSRAMEFQVSESDRAATLNNRGLNLMEKHERTGGLDEIDEGITNFREALEILKKGNDKTHALQILSNLGNALAYRHLRTNSRQDLDEAINCGTETVQDNTEPIFNVVLSRMLLMRYMCDDHQEDLEGSIRHAEAAITPTPMDHPNQLTFLEQLGHGLAVKERKCPSSDTRSRCIGVYSKIWGSQMAQSSDRVHSAWQAGRYLYKDEKHEEAAEMLGNAISLVPRLNPRWIGRADQQNKLSSLTGLPGDAAIVALQAGRDASYALRLLELGRGVMMGIEIDYRSEISHMEVDDYPELFQKFNTLRMTAEAADIKPWDQDKLHGGIRRREAASEVDRLVQEIRQLPGHENFLLPPEAADLMKMALDGPIVTICTSSLTNTGAAIIVQSSAITSLPLPKLSHSEATEKMTEMAQKVLKISLKTFVSRNEKMRALLLWLWIAAIEPVLNHLGFLRGKEDNAPLPHVRWMGVGPLSSAPFHAAGDCKSSSASNAMSQVISSYIPTLRALAYAQERKPKKYLNRRQDARLLVVSMPETPGAAPLPSAGTEAAATLAAAAAASIRGTRLDTPAAAHVLDQLPLHGLVHFACHGVSDRADPSRSRLLLADAPLSVAQILRRHAAAPDLAFLAACSTAHSHAARLADESIHIANSFQQIGFRHVVGSLWAADDGVCQDVARGFYERLFEGDGAGWEGRWEVAEALHRAVDSVRVRESGFPLLWASFVTFGG